MPLHLTDRQLEEIRAFEDLLSRPFCEPSLDAWSRRIHEVATDLFGVDRSLLVLPEASGEVRVDSPNICRGALEGLRAAMLGPAHQVNRYGDPILNQGMQRLAMAGVEVWTRDIAERVSRVQFEEMPRFYPEVIQPNRMEGLVAMGHSLEEGRAMFQVVPERPGQTRFGADAVEVFQLLLPSFKAGTRAISLAAGQWKRLQESLAVLDEGVVIYRDGVEEYRNPALRRMLAAEHRSQKLLPAAEECGDALRRRLMRPSAARGAAPVSTTLQTPDNRYHLSAVWLEGGGYGRPLVVMVVVRPAVPPLPGEWELMDRYGLTARQAQIALLLARGHSNREIAQRLGISRHTARHHAQTALEKIGASGRKALALRLLADRDL